MFLTTNLTNLHEKHEIVLTTKFTNGHELFMNDYMAIICFNHEIHGWA